MAVVHGPGCVGLSGNSIFLSLPKYTRGAISKSEAAMQTMTDDEVKDFIKQNQWATGLQIDEDGQNLYYDDAESSCIELRFPEMPFRVPYFTRVLSMLNIDAEEHFGGAVLWVTYCDIGSPQLVKTGWKIVEKMRTAFGETRELRAAPGHSFRSDEFVELNAFLLPCFVFGWDAYLLPAGQDHFVYISHDEYWTVVTKTTDTHLRLLKELEPLQPRLAHETTRARFCRGNDASTRPN